MTQVAHKLTFPPFPSLPASANLIQFKNFKESGILVQPNADGCEVDGAGIPTVALPGSHTTNYCKTNALKYSNKAGAAKKHGSASAANADLLRTDWASYWRAEYGMVTQRYDSSMPSTDRLLKICDDFQKRKWPLPGIGVKEIFDKFIAFIGVMDQNIPKTNPPKIDEEEEEEDYDEDGEDDVMMDTAPAVDKQSRTDLVSASVTVEEFLEDPVKFVKTFLSSQMVQLGLVFADKNLLNAPVIVAFFLDYIIQSKAFPKSRHEKAFTEALAVADIAKDELILKSKIAKIMPDAFNSGCIGCFGHKAEGYLRPDDVEVGDGATTEESPTPAPAPTPAESSSTASGWGAASTGWGDVASEEFNAPSTGWDSVGEDNSWIIPQPKQELFELFGPTTFPLTHSAGVVEWSVRRIKSISAPNKPPYAKVPKINYEAGEEVNPKTNELHFERFFHRIVLEPWIGWEDEDGETESANPRILRTSRGPVVEFASETGIVEVGDSLPGVAKPHNPMTDSITILASDAIAENLRVGMGLGGTWVQLARNNGSQGRYWYLEDMILTLPSFHLPLTTD